ncbi:MAG TPA: hypothetical protein VHD83_06910 [Puia sp.]|nr:hypothetical protein [Puia sp.]
MKIKSRFEHLYVFSHLFRWTLLVVPVAVTAGSLVALFPRLLDRPIRTAR